MPRGMYGLLGPNGAGKSTLMRIVATLQQPTAGSVTFDGVDILADPFAIRRVLGYLPQEFGVYPRISAEDLLDHLAVLKGIGPAKLRREQVDALLQQTNLYDARKRAVSTYSGGMRQRFGIAQALLGNPQIIIVDEPTAGLDPDRAASLPRGAVRDRRDGRGHPLDPHPRRRVAAVQPRRHPVRRPRGRGRRVVVAGRDAARPHLAQDRAAQPRSKPTGATST